MAGSETASELAVLRHPLRHVNGEQALLGLRAALAWLEANQQEINDLNVFPVPDGDTGSNMYLTMRSAVEEAQHAKSPNSIDSVMAAAAHGSLMGARGNSGVILSQIFRGLAQGLSGHDKVDAAGVAAAFREASTVAYRAVMKPTEGTILTVIRESAVAAEAAAEEGDDIRVILNRVVQEAHAAVERTTDQLAVLREAGVVDAGGFGLAIIVEGFARAVNDSEHLAGAQPPMRRVSEPSVRIPAPAGAAGMALSGRRGAAAMPESAEGFGYCTEFLISGSGLDVDAIRSDLAALGESALVVGDPGLIRVHIHTHDPAVLIGAAAQRGRLSKLKVEDMTAQHHEVLERAGAAETAARATGAATTAPKPLGVVTVAPASGFREIFESLGADAVVSGGQTMNPSIEDLLNSVNAVNARALIVLPNNTNVILTAEQVDALADGRDVSVVPTQNLPQGIAALLAFDPAADVETNHRRMLAATEKVHAIEVTRAVRDSTADGKDIKAGNVIAVVDGHIDVAGTEYDEVIEAALQQQAQEPELITVYRGDGISDEEAEQLVDRLRHAHPAVEFELQLGGQEHYPYVLSLE